MFSDFSPKFTLLEYPKAIEPTLSLNRHLYQTNTSFKCSFRSWPSRSSVIFFNYKREELAQMETYLHYQYYPSWKNLVGTVQNFAARIVSGTREFDQVTPILKQLQWLPIVKQLEVRDAKMVFKCLNGLAPPYLCQKFKTRSKVHNCNTRNRDRLHIPLCRMAAGQRAFTFRGQRLWNSLPDEFQSITNLDVFKVKIKQHS